MAQIKWLGVQGTLTEAITDTSSVIESAGLVDLPPVSDPHYAYIVIDPNGAAGRPELVVVTGHEDLATPDTYATVTRGQHTEHGGSVARSHAAGTPWYHAASPKDFNFIAVDDVDRESQDVNDGAIVWQQDTQDHWVYVDGATPTWEILKTYDQFVYNSSAVAAAGNTYSDWDELVEALHAEAGFKRIIFVQDETIPPGAYNLDNVTLVGNGLEYDQGGVTLTFGDNTTIGSWANPGIDSVRLLSTSTTGPIWTQTSPVLWRMTTVSHVHCLSEPFLSFSGTGQMILALLNSARFRRLSGGVEMVEVTSAAFGCQLILSRGNGSTVDNNTFRSTNAVVYLDIISDVANDVVSSPWPSTHTNLNIGVNAGFYQTIARALGFTPAGSIVATNVQTAIQELDTDITAHIVDAYDAHDASAVSFNAGATPGSTLVALDVQAAIEEVSNDVTALGTIASGTFTPTSTHVVNVSSSTPLSARWVRIGNQVVVYGRCEITPTVTPANTRLRLTIPVASNFGANSDAAGMMVGDRSDMSPGVIRADITEDQVVLEAYPSDDGGLYVYGYNYGYTVI